MAKFTRVKSSGVLHKGNLLSGAVENTALVSTHGGVSEAIDAVLAMGGGKVVVDTPVTLTGRITRDLNGSNITIVSTSQGVLSYSGALSEDTYLPLFTFNGSGVESVTTKVRMIGNKVRGVGGVLVGFVVNNVHSHFEGSDIEGLSAGVNTVTAKLFMAEGATYRNMPQQLTTQQWPGVYGYGVVPIDCELIVVNGCILGEEGKPVDRHAVYCSTATATTGSSRAAIVTNNKVFMRNYSTSEAPQTDAEFAFKFISVRSVHLSDNEQNGGVGVGLFTCHKGIGVERLSIFNNRCRVYRRAFEVAAQDASAGEADATWSVGDVNCSDNIISFTSAEDGVANAVKFRNVHRFKDVGSSYRFEAVASTTGLALYNPVSGRIRCESLEVDAVSCRGFRQLFRGEAPLHGRASLRIMNAVNTFAPVNLTSNTNFKVYVEDTDNSANWKQGYTSAAQGGFSYKDQNLGIEIVNKGAGVWDDVLGYRRVGLSAERPNGVPVGFIYWETDQNRAVRWTGSKWVLLSAGYSGIISSGTKAQIEAINKAMLGYGHQVYCTDTKKPAFFDEYSQSWKYADGTTI